jgi:hypothetical protein
MFDMFKQLLIDVDAFLSANTLAANADGKEDAIEMIIEKC